MCYRLTILISILLFPFAVFAKPLPLGGWEEFEKTLDSTPLYCTENDPFDFRGPLFSNLNSLYEIPLEDNPFGSGSKNYISNLYNWSYMRPNNPPIPYYQVSLNESVFLNSSDRYKIRSSNHVLNNDYEKEKFLKGFYNQADRVYFITKTTSDYIPLKKAGELIRGTAQLLIDIVSVHNALTKNEDAEFDKIHLPTLIMSTNGNIQYSEIIMGKTGNHGSIEPFSLTRALIYRTDSPNKEYLLWERTCRITSNIVTASPNPPDHLSASYR